jgi:parvulin-like peptidyl-prolyl isomerase
MCGDLGWLQAGAFEPAFEAAARLLKPGNVSDVVCCSDGVHVLLRLG